MLKQVIYRYTGQKGIERVDDRGKRLQHGQFITKAVYDRLPSFLTIRQEVHVAR